MPPFALTHQIAEKHITTQRCQQNHHVIPRCLALELSKYGVAIELLESKTVRMAQNGNHPDYTCNIVKALSIMGDNVNWKTVREFADNLVKMLSTYNKDVDPDSVQFEDICSCIPNNVGTLNYKEKTLSTGRVTRLPVRGDYKR